MCAMRSIVVSDPVGVWKFINKFTPLRAVSDMKGLGLERDGELIAGVLYEGWNGRNVWMHVAIAPGARITREYIRHCFRYPFIELGCRRISGYVNASNKAACRFDEHLGFRQEAALIGAAPDGGDVIVYVMWREDCKYV